MNSFRLVLSVIGRVIVCLFVLGLAMAEFPGGIASVAAAQFGKFSAIGTGTITDPGDCSNLPACPEGDTYECVTLNATLTGTMIGKSSLTVNFNDDTNAKINNGTGGECNGVSGIGLLTTANQSTINVGVAGLLCETPDSGGDTHEVLNAQYSLRGASGRFANARGIGVVQAGEIGEMGPNKTEGIVMTGGFIPR